MSNRLGKIFIDATREKTYRRAAELYNGGTRAAEIIKQFDWTPAEYHRASVWARYHGLRGTKKPRTTDEIPARPKKIPAPRPTGEWPTLSSDAFRGR